MLSQVWVIMKNDFPERAFSSAADADKFIRDQTEFKFAYDQTELEKAKDKFTTRRVYWRSYKLPLD